MDNWEISDDVLVQHAEQWEAEREYVCETQLETVNDVVDGNVESDFVPETQFETVVDGNDVVGGTNLESYVRVTPPNQRPWPPICNDYSFGHPSWPICQCGYKCFKLVCKFGRNAGRRYFGCPEYQGDLWNRNGAPCCEYVEWIDPEMCIRGAQYAREMQVKVEGLEANVR